MARGKRSRTGGGVPGGCSASGTFPPTAWSREINPSETAAAPICSEQSCRIRPADGGGVGLVLAEAVDALDGGRLDVVSQEEAVIPPRSPAGLLHHHHHQSLDGVAVSRHAVPVAPLQLRKQPPTAAGSEAAAHQQRCNATPPTQASTFPWMVHRIPIFWQKA